MSEKDYNPSQKENKAMRKQRIIEKTKIVDAPKEKTEIKEDETKEKIIDEKETKKEKKKIEKIKKEEAVVNAKSLPISTKFSVAICNFIRGKKIETALADLEDVLNKKRAVPIKGEYAHKKGKGMSSGKYPKNATEHFIKIIKSLRANSNYNSIENPVIVEAIANKASQPYGRFGRIRRKRTHVTLKAKERVIRGEKK